MIVRQTRIFAPHEGLFAHSLWAETVIGLIIKPVVIDFRTKLEWFWFTRYFQGSNGDIDDCVFFNIPAKFICPSTRCHKSIRFRYAIDDNTREGFEGNCRELISKAGCAISDFRDYPILADLGGNRHIEEPRSQERRERRSLLVVKNYHSIAELILDALIGPDNQGRFSIEKTPFYTFRHILCNAVGIQD